MLLPFSNLQARHWNPGASMPLVLPLIVVCNTTDEMIHRNIRENARSQKDWLRVSEPHGRIAVLCGSGPSLADTLDDIRRQREEGADVFAMNGAARFLADNGILADYQVMCDARLATADLIGPAKAHLFASQVDPECFRRMPKAQLWHLHAEGIDDHLPSDYPDDYALLGGGASVGNTSMCLAYAMGFRQIDAYGFDSSHRDGESHAFRQPLNDDEGCTWVKWNGKEYLISLGMKMQAEKFQTTARALQYAGMTIRVHGTGLVPDMWNTKFEFLSEREKYERMWAEPGYRDVSPGEESVATFFEIAKPSGTVIDFGCGTGRAALLIRDGGCEVVMIDFASNCRDQEAMQLPFFEFDLCEPIPIRGDVGYCTDVMEHIPPADVERVIQNVMACVPMAFFQISTVPDMAGAIINQCLHLTVEPHAWWHGVFERLGFEVTWDKNYPGLSQFLIAAKPANQ